MKVLLEEPSVLGGYEFDSWPFQGSNRLSYFDFPHLLGIGSPPMYHLHRRLLHVHLSEQMTDVDAYFVPVLLFSLTLCRPISGCKLYRVEIPCWMVECDASEGMEAEEKAMVISLPGEEAWWNGSVVPRVQGYS